ncbi:MAG: PmoA family protein, partial [Paludibaculum sp.]
MSVEIDGKPFTDFFIAGAEVTKPYLHPLRAASGTYVTRMWPMAEVAGEPTDHKHQRGLWLAHAKVNELDFWIERSLLHHEESWPHRTEETRCGEEREGPGLHPGDLRMDGPGRRGGSDGVAADDLPQNGPAHGRLDHRLTAVVPSTFTMRRTGHFACIRPDLQEQKHSGKIVNAEGLETEKAAWGKPSNWVRYAGDVDGEKLGIAIFDHPGNPRHPVRWHVHQLRAVRGQSIWTGGIYRRQDERQPDVDAGAVRILSCFPINLSN